MDRCGTGLLALGLIWVVDVMPQIAGFHKAAVLHEEFHAEAGVFSENGDGCAGEVYQFYIALPFRYLHKGFTKG